MLAASYPFLDVLWSMVIFFMFFIWIMILFKVFADLFRRRDIGGGMKTVWVIFVIVLPFLGVFIYLIVNHDGMTQRAVRDQQAAQQQLDDHIRSVAPSSSTEEIAKAKQLLDSGAINQAEYESLKAKALAAG